MAISGKRKSAAKQGTRKDDAFLESSVVLFAEDGRSVVLFAKPEKPVWYAECIGRRILPEVYEKRHGVNGYYPENPDYEERGIYLNFKVKLDDDGFIKEITFYKEKTVECSPHYRPVKGRELALTKADIRDFKTWLDGLVVAVDEPGAIKPKPNLPQAEDLLPAGWTPDSFKAGFLRLCKAVEKGDLKAIKEFAPCSRLVLPECQDVKRHPFVNAARKGNRAAVEAMVEAGGWILDRYFIYGEGYWDAIRHAMAKDDRSLAVYLLEQGKRRRSSYPSCPAYNVSAYGYGVSLMEYAKSFEMVEAIWPYLDEHCERFSPKDGMEFGFDRALRLVKLNPRARFAWTAEIYRGFQKNERKLLDKLQKAGVLDLDLDFYVDSGDLKGFKAALAQLAIELPDEYESIPSSVWTRDDKWFKAAKEYLQRPVKYSSNGYSNQFSHALCDIFQSGEYELYISVAERGPKKLDDVAFYCFDFPKKGMDEKLATRILEYMFGRHPKGRGSYWSDEFVVALFVYCSADFLREKVEKCPEMLSGKCLETLAEAVVLARPLEDGVLDLLISTFKKREEAVSGRSDPINDLRSSLEFEIDCLKDSELGESVKLEKFEAAMKWLEDKLRRRKPLDKKRRKEPK